ncbi:hypothetical protein AOQ72_16250 [Bradyrhizobium yuanmingense]|uniref:Uncharacterized protein n=1 Tax=Bradyrhizobium yuanmingense TaxID=108015 RepID=A0A0R3CUZ3_9BRAD|nr:hypothetical protein AOQ72_16250 [Bradyrhizobium yuanmingense]
MLDDMQNPGKNVRVFLKGVALQCSRLQAAQKIPPIGLSMCAAAGARPISCDLSFSGDSTSSSPTMKPGLSLFCLTNLPLLVKTFEPLAYGLISFPVA